MGKNSEFSDRLTEIVYKIRSKSSHITLGGIQDNLGRALGRTGRSAIEHWRKGYVPKRETLEELTLLLVKDGDLDRNEVEFFLDSADHPYVDEFCDRIFATPLPQQPGQPHAKFPLPSQPYHQLYGRETTIVEIVEKLHPLSDHHCVVVDGIPGVGKTSLAHGVAEQCLRRKIFQRIIWLDAGENGTIHPQIMKQPGPLWMTIFDAIWYQLVDVDIEDVATVEIADKRWELQQLLNNSPTLLIIDNLGLLPDPQNRLIQQLLPLLGRSKALCLSICRLSGNVYPIHLSGLSQTAAQEFIRAESQAKKIRYLDKLQDSELEEFVEITGGSPLAMKLVSSQLDHLPLERILHHLKTVKPLTAIRDQDAYVQFYQSIYQSLWKNLSTNSQRLLVTLSLLVPGRGETQAILALLHGEADAQKLYQGITELWNVSLIESIYQEDHEILYHLHALTQQFVVAEVVGWYQRHHPEKSNKFLLLFQENLARGLRYLLESSSGPSVETRNFALHLLSYAIELPDLWPDTSKLLLAIAPQMCQSHGGTVWTMLLEKGIEQAATTQDRETEAELYFYLGRRLHESEMDLDAAAQAIEKSLACSKQAKNPSGQARALNELASVARLQRQFEQGIQWAEEALSLSDCTDIERAASYITLGMLALDQHRSAQAEAWFEQALQLVENQNEVTMSATILTSMGVALRLQAEYDQAAVYYQQAIALFEDMEKPIQQAIAMMNLGNIFILLEKPGKALRQYEQAEPILRRAHMEFYLTKLYTNQGIAHCRLGHWPTAQVLIESSIKRWEKMGNMFSLANAVDELGLIYGGKEEWAMAIAKFRRALDYLHNEPPSIARDNLEKEITGHLNNAKMALNNI